MPDGHQISLATMEQIGALDRRQITQGAPPYVPPAAMILRGLDATELDFAAPRVSVCASFLKFLVSEFARTLPFDADYYATRYPDVEAARLAGDVPSLHAHFIGQGYFEARQPCALPFDPYYYATRYDDLAQVFGPHQGPALHAHFTDHGWQEGRVGVESQRADAERWVAAAR